MKFLFEAAGIALPVGGLWLLFPTASDLQFMLAGLLIVAANVIGFIQGRSGA